MFWQLSEEDYLKRQFFHTTELLICQDDDQSEYYNAGNLIGSLTDVNRYSTTLLSESGFETTPQESIHI